MDTLNSQIILQEVSIDQIMKMAKLLSNANNSLTKTEIFKGFSYQTTYVILERALKANIELKIIIQTEETYKINPDAISEIKTCDVPNLAIIFRKYLQNYPPFLLYVSLLNQGFDQIESAAFLKSLMNVNNSEKQISIILNRWGKGSGALKKSNDGVFIVPNSVKPLSKEYLDKLVQSLNNDMGVKNFLIDILDNRTFAYLSKKGLDLNSITKGLLEHEESPKNAMISGISFIEPFLRKISKDLGIDVTNTNGIGGIVKKLEDSNKIPHCLANCGYGIGGVRNICDHGIDKTSSEVWSITPIGSLSSILFSVILIKSYYLYLQENECSF